MTCVNLDLKCVIIQSDDYESEESEDDPKDDHQDINQEKSDIPVPESQVSTPDDCKLIDKWIFQLHVTVVIVCYQVLCMLQINEFR